jgi:hypothetical protein
MRWRVGSFRILEMLTKGKPMGYKGHKAQWDRDTGNVHGHPTKHPALHQHSQHHTPFQSRGFSEDTGSNCKPESIHTNYTNRMKHDPDKVAPNKANTSHDPLPGAFHGNSGTSSDGHKLIRRGASKFPVA